MYSRGKTLDVGMVNKPASVLGRRAYDGTNTPFRQYARYDPAPTPPYNQYGGNNTYTPLAISNNAQGLPNQTSLTYNCRIPCKECTRTPTPELPTPHVPSPKVAHQTHPEDEKDVRPA